MERRQLGKSGIEVPVVGFGTYKVFNVSGDADIARCESVVDAALEHGANFFDSSPMYGKAESVLARVLEGRRDDAIVATKVWAKSRAIGEGQIEKALEWFERVDLYQVHNLLCRDDHLPYLHHLKEGGRVRAVGATHYLPSAYSDLIEMIRHAEIDTIQVPYHPLERTAGRDLLDEAQAHDVGVIGMMPLGSGRLLREAPPRAELEPLDEYGVYTWPQVLLKWILSDERVHCVIPATSNADHARENAVAGDPPWFDGDARTYVRQLAKKYS
jgi:aryl-alcohol dehydrogenase-like predicted oxidoreductase